MSLPDFVGPRETIARFLMSSGHYSGGRVRPNAFMPPTGTTELSVFRIDNLSPNDVWQIGEKIATARDRKLHGSGNLVASSIIELRLSIRPDNTPPRHANITGLPLRKEDCQDIALKLAEKATLVLRPN